MIEELLTSFRVSGSAGVFKNIIFSKYHNCREIEAQWRKWFYCGQSGENKRTPLSDCQTRIRFGLRSFPVPTVWPRPEAAKGLKAESPGVKFHHFLEMTTRNKWRISGILEEQQTVQHHRGNKLL